jgi:hypothetical protein
MAVAPALEGQKGGCGSQFFITLGDNIDYLDGKHAVFGHVVEGLDTLDKLNEIFVDQDNRPFKDVRIRHVIILGMHFFYIQLIEILNNSQMTHSLIHRDLSNPLRRLHGHQTTRLGSPRTKTRLLHSLKRRKSGCDAKKPQQHLL